eukprot:TRINITY_DN5730_c0_g1_i1.p1 TRINITY_DN5730_c0_g1~~TRINITY_DN5730_c0_g1_i1.p1  ORF type:complete len:212 (+),score=47.95 TRINITY_DN5730_c0_g1_i1:72-638(+)
MEGEEKFLEDLKKRFSVWESEPSVVEELSNFVFNCKNPAPHLNTLFSFILPLSQHFETENKVLGVRLFNDLINKASGKELSPHSEAIYLVLQHNLFYKEFKLVENTLFTMIELLDKVERHGFHRYNLFVETVLKEMERSMTVDFRIAYMTTLLRLAEKMQIHIVKHLRVSFHFFNGLMANYVNQHFFF